MGLDYLGVSVPLNHSAAGGQEGERRRVGRHSSKIRITTEIGSYAVANDSR